MGPRWMVVLNGGWPASPARDEEKLKVKGGVTSHVIFRDIFPLASFLRIALQPQIESPQNPQNIYIHSFIVLEEHRKMSSQQEQQQEAQEIGRQMAVELAHYEQIAGDQARQAAAERLYGQLSRSDLEGVWYCCKCESVNNVINNCCPGCQDVRCPSCPVGP